MLFVQNLVAKMATLKSDKCILVFDLGNSTLASALFKNDDIVFFKKYISSNTNTVKDFHQLIKVIKYDVAIKCEKIDEILLSSVVTSKTEICSNALKDVFGENVTIVSNTKMTPFVSTYNSEIGTDIYANLVEARVKNNNTPCIVVDFGTALTISAIDKRGAIIGVVIRPGILTSLKGLFRSAPLLETLYNNNNHIVVSDSTKADNTQNAIDIGLYYGTKGEVKEICEFYKKQAQSDCYIIATGGEAEKYAPFIGIFDEIDEKHTLKGIYDIYYRA